MLGDWLIGIWFAGSLLSFGALVWFTRREPPPKPFDAFMACFAWPGILGFFCVVIGWLILSKEGDA